MKRIVLAGLGMVALAASAGAADMPSRRYDAPPRMYVQQNTWTGFYIGINGGGAWATPSGPASAPSM